MATASAAMAAVGQAANLPAMQQTMQQFAKENAKMDMASEMMDDAVDDAMDDDEEEADDVMNQVSIHLSCFTSTKPDMWSQMMQHNCFVLSFSQQSQVNESRWAVLSSVSNYKTY